jgi:crossover junction endodeoxyribonuclease RuvC
MRGPADKAQVTYMVMRLLRLTDPPRPADTADALALAICHLWRGGTQNRIAAAGSLMERRLAAARGEIPDQLAAARRERDQKLRGAR